MKQCEVKHHIPTTNMCGDNQKRLLMMILFLLEPLVEFSYYIKNKIKGDSVHACVCVCMCTC